MNLRFNSCISAAILGAGLFVAGSGSARAQSGATAPDPRDAALKKVRLDQRLNQQVPTDLAFQDEQGRSVRLSDYLGSKPVMLMMIQFRCTMLCAEQVRVLTDSLKQIQFTPGKEFNLLIVSIDPREGPELGKDMKDRLMAEYGRPQADAGWRFLTGSKATIDHLAAAVGFHYYLDTLTDQYAHPDGVMILTPEGKVSHYYFRLDYPPRDMRLGLVEASKNRIGSPLDALALLCFHYNPITGKYALAVMALVRTLGIVTVALIIGGVVIARRRDRMGAHSLAAAGLAGKG